MDALIPAFVVVLLCETGGPMQAIACEAADRPGGKAGVLIALLLSSLVYYGIALVAGLLISGMITPNPKTLFLAMALLFAGVPMLLRPKPVALKKGGFAGTLNGFVSKQFGDASSFVLLAMAARSPMPELVVPGGLAGVMVAGAAPLILGRAWPLDLMQSLARRGAAVILIASAAWLAVTALGIV